MSRLTEQVVEPAKNGIEPIDITRQPLHLKGTIYDINRVMQACRHRLAFLENSGCDVNSKYVVYVRAPQSDEP